MSARLVALAVCLGLFGCAGVDSSKEDPSPGFSTINRQIFEPNCTFACHSGGQFAAGGLDMKTAPYATLVDAHAVAGACEGSRLVRVAPGKPEESLVYLKVTSKADATAAPCGEGMPAGVDRHALTPAEVDAIAAWIEGGAPED